MTQRRAAAPGKLLLFGEHAAVYGYPAVGVSLDRSLTVEVAPAPEWNFCFGGQAPCDDFDGEYQDFFPHLESVAARAGYAEQCADLRGHISVSTDLPIAAGFGSSAALCGAVARLLLPDDAVSEEIWRIAHRLEAFFHGTASGIVTGLSVLEGSLVFRFSQGREIPEAHPLALPEAAVVYGALPRQRSTRELVAAVRGHLESDPSATRDILNHLGTIADAVATGNAGDAHTLGTLASRAHALLRDLGVSSEAMNQLISKGIDAGALGGKLSGAGGGGAYFFVCHDLESARRVAAALNHRDYRRDTDGAAPPAILRIGESHR